MYLNPLDSHSAHQISNRSNFNLFSIVNGVSRSGIIQNLIVDNLVNAKTSLVLVPNNHDALFIRSCLSEANLDHLCLLVTDNKTISAKDLAQLRSVVKDTDRSKGNNEFEILTANANKAITNLKESYDQLNKKIFGERSWRVLSAQKEHFHYYNEVNLVKRKIDIDEITFTQKEYWNIRGRIQEASNRYINKFDFLQKVDSLSPSIYQEDHIDDKVVALEKLINKGSHLLHNFGGLIENISNGYKQAGLEDYEQLSAMTAAADHSLSEYIRSSINGETSKGIQGKLKKVFAQTTGESDLTKLRQQVQFLHSEFSESTFFTLDVDKPDFDNLTEHSIKEIIERSTTVLANWQHYLRSYTQSKLKQLSPLNSENYELKTLDEKLGAYLKEVNDAQLLEDKVEDNTLSMYKKIDLLETILEKLRTGFAILTENEDYIEWRIMLAYCKSGTSNLITALKDHPVKAWTGIFDQLFIGNILDKNQSPRLPKNASQLQHICDIISESRSAMSNSIERKWQTQKKSQLVELKKENKNLHTSIAKKKEEIDMSWAQMISKSPNTIAAIYPVIIVCQDAVKNIKPLYYKWSECISYDWTSFSDTGSMRIKGFSLRQTVLETEALNEDVERKLKAYFNSNHIKGENLIGDQIGSVHQSMKELENAEKLRIAKAMSKNILSIDSTIRLFYLKGACIISCLSDKENIRVVDMLTQFGIKEVGQQYSLHETILDMLVDTSKVCYLLTEDGLINTAAIENFDWQYHNLKILDKLGCQIINVWTANAEEAYQSLLNKIRSQNPKTTALPDEKLSEPNLIKA